MSEILKVEHLKKYFKTNKGMLHAVDDVSFSIEEGKTLGVVGESGCGKSTLGRTLIRLEPPTSGVVTFDGISTEDSKLNKKQLKEYRRNMQMIFQDPYSSLDPRYTVSELIAEPLINYHVYSNKNEMWDAVFSLMETVGLDARYANAYPHELDGGRRQRIGVARALALEPKFIVCDEPVSALDVSIQAQILNLMQDLQKERNLTYMFITHNMSVVKHISDDIIVMYLGKIVEHADSDSIFANTLHPYTKALLDAVPIAELGAKKNRTYIQGELSSPIDPKPGCRFAARCPFAKEKCFSEDPVLEEVLPHHRVACHYVKEINNL